MSHMIRSKYSEILYQSQLKSSKTTKDTTATAIGQAGQTFPEDSDRLLIVYPSLESKQKGPCHVSLKYKLKYCFIRRLRDRA